VHVYDLIKTYGPHTLCTPRDGWDELPAEERAGLSRASASATPPPISSASSTPR
jgi:hypothetical protein